MAQILEFLPGMETAEVNITIIDDKCSASQTTLVVQLSSEVGVVISPFAKVEITIEDDDSESICSNSTVTIPEPGVYKYDMIAYSVKLYVDSSSVYT